MPHDYYSSSSIRTDFLNTVVKQLVKKRHTLGLSQEDINFELGVADRLVSKWECGTRTPNVFNLYCWADVLESKLIVVPKDYDLFDQNLDPLMFKASNDNKMK